MSAEMPQRSLDAGDRREGGGGEVKSRSKVAARAQKLKSAGLKIQSLIPFIPLCILGFISMHVSFGKHCIKMHRRASLCLTGRSPLPRFPNQSRYPTKERFPDPIDDLNSGHDGDPAEEAERPTNVGQHVDGSGSRRLPNHRGCLLVELDQQACYLRFVESSPKI